MPRPILRDSIQGINKPAIHRLAKKAGVGQISGLVYEEVRGVIKLFLEKVLNKAILIIEHLHKKTLNSSDVHEALRMVYHKFIGEPPSKRCAIFKGKKTGVREIKFYQKNSDCFHIPKLPFKRVVLEVSQDYIKDLRISSGAVDLLQEGTEVFVSNLLSASYLIAVACKKKKLEPKHIQLAQALSKIPLPPQL